MEELAQQAEQATAQRIAVWCGALAAYNAGCLHGEWLDADVEPDVLWDGVHHILATSPEPNEEEFGWFDHEGFEGIRIGEHDSVERVTTLARLIREHGVPFACWFSYDESIDLDTADEAFTEAYIGEFDAESEFHEHLYSEHGLEDLEAEAHKHLPEWATLYLRFDVEQYAFDLEQNGDVYSAERNGKHYYFWTR